MLPENYEELFIFVDCLIKHKNSLIHNSAHCQHITETASLVASLSAHDDIMEKLAKLLLQVCH
jgi:hypothetical protein